MNKILLYLTLALGLFFLAGCEQTTNKYLDITANSEDKIVIETQDVTSKAEFLNYKIDDVTIQLIVVRGTDGKVRIAFNTCQVCSPSPKAYFIQSGEYIICQNCGTKFHINKVGEEKGGCNPTPVEEQIIEGNRIILSKSYVESFKDKFADWQGPTN